MPNVNTYPPRAIFKKKNIQLTRENIGNYFISHPVTEFFTAGQSTDDTGVNHEQFSYGWVGLWNTTGNPQNSPVWADSLQINNTTGWTRKFYPFRNVLWDPFRGLHDSSKGAVNALGRFLQVLDYFNTAGPGGARIKVLWIIQAFRRESPLTTWGNDQAGADGEQEFIDYLDALFSSTQTSPQGFRLALHPALGGIEVVNEQTQLNCNHNNKLLYDPIGEVHANYARIVNRKLFQYRNDPAILAANPGLQPVQVALFGGSGGVSENYLMNLSAHARSQARTDVGLATVSSNTINRTAHGLVAGDYVWLELEQIAGGAFSNWKTATYFINPLTNDTFTLSSTFGGPAITGGVDQSIEVYQTLFWLPFTTSTTNSATAYCTYNSTTGVFTMTNAATNYGLRTLEGGAVCSTSSDIVQGVGVSFNLRNPYSQTVDANTFNFNRAFNNDVLTTFDGQFVGEIDFIQNPGRSGTLKLKANAAITTSRVLTGTIAVTQNSATVTGTGTAFTSQVKVADRIFTNAGVFIGNVRSITNDTTLVLAGNYTAASQSGIAATTYDCLQVRSKAGLRGALPSVMGANLWQNRPYYVVSTGLTADAFRIATHPGGAALTLNAIAAGLRVRKSTPFALSGDDGVSKTALDYGINSHHYYGGGGNQATLAGVVPGPSPGTGRFRHIGFMLERHEKAVGIAENILSMAGEYALGGITNVNTTTGDLTLEADARLQNGQRVIFQATTAPTGLTLGQIYFVVNAVPASRTIRVSLTQGGAAIVPSTAGTAVTVWQCHNWYGQHANSQAVWNTEYNPVENNDSTSFGNSGNILRYYHSICNQAQKDAIFLATTLPGILNTHDGNGGVGVAFNYGADLTNGTSLDGLITSWSVSPNNKLRITTNIQPNHSNGSVAGFTVQNGTAETICIDCRTGPGIDGVCPAGQTRLYKISGRYGNTDIEIDAAYAGPTLTTAGNRWILQRYAYGPDGPTWNKWMDRLLTGSPKIHFGLVHGTLQPLVHIEGKGIWYLDADGNMVEHI